MKIALMGDTAFYGKFSLKEGSPKNKLKKTAEVLKTFDYVVLNLETPFAKENAKKYGNKSAYIKSDPENIELLKFLGVDAVCLANNHMFDFGYESFELTKKLLADNGIEYFGVENKDLEIEISGNRISFSGFCCYSSSPINATPKGVNILDYKLIEKQLIKDELSGFASIVSIHAGQEHINYPNYDHIDLARKLSKKNPYVFYGHHPHVLQGIEKYNDSLIAYSLGNFCFDDVYTDKSIYPLIKMNHNNKESTILSLEYNYSKLISYELIPLFDGELCEVKKNNDILEKINEYSNALQLDRQSYNLMRSDLLINYLSNRKSMRNLEWYIKRINYNSFKILVNSYLNKKKYNKVLKKHL